MDATAVVVVGRPVVDADRERLGRWGRIGGPASHRRILIPLAIQTAIFQIACGNLALVTLMKLLRKKDRRLAMHLDQRAALLILWPGCANW